MSGRIKSNVASLSSPGRIRYNDPSYQMKLPKDFFDAQGRPEHGLCRLGERRDGHRAQQGRQLVHRPADLNEGPRPLRRAFFLYDPLCLQQSGSSVNVPVDGEEERVGRRLTIEYGPDERETAALDKERVLSHGGCRTSSTTNAWNSSKERSSRCLRTIDPMKRQRGACQHGAHRVDAEYALCPRPASARRGRSLRS